MEKPTSTPAQVFAAFLRLGLTSFGGPAAHIGYFRADFVTRRGWIDDQGFAALLALAQFLPGPASSQLGFALGLHRAGWAGALAAFAGFTLPSALVMMAFAALWQMAPGDALSGVIAGLKLVAVAVVAEALRGMARSLTPDAPRIALAVGALVAVLALPGALIQITVILTALAIGAGLRMAKDHAVPPAQMRHISRRGGLVCLAGFALLMAGLPLIAHLGPLPRIAASFWWAGSLVFGGGHVVLPLLSSATVATGAISGDAFLAGYGAAQAVPGPLFTFAGFLGQAMAGLPGAAVALAAIFAPGFLLMAGIMPFWSAVAAQPRTRHALAGANAAVVGILAAALINPVAASALHGIPHVLIALALWAGLALLRWPPLAIVAIGAASGLIL